MQFFVKYFYKKWGCCGYWCTVVWDTGKKLSTHQSEFHSFSLTSHQRKDTGTWLCDRCTPHHSGMGYLHTHLCLQSSHKPWFYENWQILISEKTPLNRWLSNVWAYYFLRCLGSVVFILFVLFTLHVIWLLVKIVTWVVCTFFYRLFLIYRELLFLIMLKIVLSMGGKLSQQINL